ncbi:exodeoxyribonuclease V subunit gamma [Desulfoprunum benzoelyticum]|uniref:Exodeoxyribonuclease V gamma subunit n=1 Tax=Desulfoprunum benzoelyticum TaxID=1506996 RepID=A0A840UUM6_9BACT|nr:exodeoxyribonuclease V subunit gamma [Desulfoprunum benzoelyticum]MBB5349482.1 exodeoxyribonuclease V gamma subunit [Desulfoprunum benzoelyticum]MBM9531815.1 exodeoxyribonuclease V subunit gamma [Desulfoprunum benzoelyticum]
MFYLHTSNRTENLLQHLAELIRAQGREDLFTPELFVVQSQGMERIISQKLAETFGTWCNFRYLLPLNFFELVANCLEMSIQPDGFAREVLVWRLEELLRDLDSPDLAVLAPYFSGENAELKRFQLARQLANLFDQYQLLRPELLARWEQGRPAVGHPTEGWQRRLWQRLVDQAPDRLHRGAVLQRIGRRLRQQDIPAGVLPGRISIVGIHIMAPLFLDLLAGLSLHSDVHLYLLSPCEQYWGDLPSRRQLARQRAAAGRASGLEDAAGHPLLVALGRQGRDFQAMLLEQVDFELEFRSFEDPCDHAASTLLHRLQSDLLHNRPGGTPPPENAAADDGSVIVVSCHSRRREMTVLHDHILDWLHRDPTLELRDIVVMAPDIQDYAALIPAVFHDLQHSIADRSLRRKNAVVATFLQFLDLLGGRFGWKEVFDLLQQEAIAFRFELTAGDLEHLRQWVTRSGIRWGLSAGQRQEIGLPADPEGTWRAGLDRLLMGYAIDAPDMVDGVLPYGDIEGGGARALGGLCEFVAILEEAERDLRRSHGLGEWSRLLLHFADRLFGEADDAVILELRQILSELDNGGFHQSPVALAVIRAWLDTAAAETRSTSGYLRGQLTFCSMLPMRSIPFRIVCLLGLGDGLFPGSDRHATFDLLAVERRYGDRSRRDDDRYQFLEALLAARDVLYISYPGQSSKTNKELPPAVVVSELLEVLRQDYGVILRERDDDPEALGFVRHHPLHPFSPRYFTGADSRFFSYDDRSRAVAARLAQPAASIAPWWSGSLAAAEEGVPIAALFGFFANPQRWFVRNCLGIRLDLQEELPAESEPFAVDPLAGYGVGQEIIQSLLAGAGAEAALARMRIEGRWPLGTPGKLLFARQQQELTSFADRIRGMAMGRRLPDLPVDVTVGASRLRGLLGNVYEGGVLIYRYSNCKGRDVLHLWLHALLADQLLGEDRRVVAVLRDCELETVTARDRSPDLACCLELFTAGCQGPSDLYVEPALSYARHCGATRSRVPPLAKAREKWQNSIDKGYEPEWTLLLQGVAAEAVLGAEFENLCRTFFVPIWEGCRCPAK